jgi:glyoxylase-like metal-dependent hydrolase (beta-lactamase superfamily II)
MEVITLAVGPQQTNCYLLVDEATQKTIIVDPADEADFISTTILEKKLIPEGILLTHGHYDHCLGSLELKLNFNIPIYLHQEDLFLYNNANKSASYWNSSLRGGTPTRQSPSIKQPPIDFFLKDNQTITFGESNLKVIHTPGHTPGSCCFLSPSVVPAKAGIHKSIPLYLFTGDTIFASGAGAADRSYSSKSDLQKSTKKISSICYLNPETAIYPGHEEYGFYLTNSLEES